MDNSRIRSIQRIGPHHPYVLSIIYGTLLGDSHAERRSYPTLKGIKKGGLKNTSQVYMSLGQAHFENQSFETAKNQFRIAARSKDEKIKKAANNWLKYTENEEVRVKNLALRRDFIQNS